MNEFMENMAKLGYIMFTQSGPELEAVGIQVAEDKSVVVLKKSENEMTCALVGTGANYIEKDIREYTPEEIMKLTCEHASWPVGCDTITGFFRTDDQSFIVRVELSEFGLPSDIYIDACDMFLRVDYVMNDEILGYYYAQFPELV